MATSSKSNSIREIVNRGTFLSLCLSLLVGSGVLVVWQWMSQVKANDYNASLVRAALLRDASDLLTSSLLKNYEAVSFQLKNALGPLPIKCAFIDLPDKRYTLKGQPGDCEHLARNSDLAHREEINSGSMQVGPLTYVLETQPLPPGSFFYLAAAFLGLVGCVVVTWGVLIKMVHDSILRPLRNLSGGLATDGYAPDQNTCDEIISLASQIRGFKVQVSSSAKREEFVRVARMVAHNINTPVLVLEGVDVNALDPTNRGIYRGALSDIKDLITSLRAEAGAVKRSETTADGNDEMKSAWDKSFGRAQHTTAKPLAVEHLQGLIEMAVAEKRLQTSTGHEIIFEPSVDSYKSFASVQRAEFKCLLLNLMNNSIEAFDGTGRVSGQITIRLTTTDQWIRITLEDNGPGIAPETLARLGERGFSVGKKNGSGLGLHHAKAMASAWGGQFTIDSVIGHGTSMSIEIPIAQPPDWFVPQIELNANTSVVVLDDDPTIGLLWRRRILAAGGRPGSFHSFERADEFKKWTQAHRDQSALFLVDYELTGQSQNGISVIEELGIAENSILVTGRYDDPGVQAKVRWNCLRMIPKPMLFIVPLSVKGMNREEILPSVTHRFNGLI